MPKPPARRRAAIRGACKASDLPLYAADLRAYRGRCRKRGCVSRWGIVRMTLDFTNERVDRFATLECATCSRTWRRVALVPIRSTAGYQAVRLTLIEPATVKRWRSRGRWHRVGDDSTILVNADLGDLDEAARAHTIRADRKADTRARAKAKREAADAALSAATQANLARWAERDAARALEEAQAAAREG